MAEVGSKRKAEGDAAGALVVKRQKSGDDGGDGGELALSSSKKSLIPAGVKRTSSLDAPIMVLEGHGAAVFCGRFSPSGEHFATGSADKNIFIWSVTGECANTDVLKGHKSAVLDLRWAPDSRNLVSASADHTCVLWDVELGERVRKWSGHSLFVNACDFTQKGPSRALSASDDGLVKVWDPTSRGSLHALKHPYAVTSAVFDAAGDRILTGSLDNIIRIWDMRKEAVVEEIKGHYDTVTGLAVSPDGHFLLSNAMDNTLKMWDMKPFVSGDRCVRTFVGHSHSAEKNLLRAAWSADQQYVSCGSADQMVNVWEADTGELVYKLPGHRGSVNDVQFHPHEPIVASCSSDKIVYVGELGAT